MQVLDGHDAERMERPHDTRSNHGPRDSLGRSPAHTEPAERAAFEGGSGDRDVGPRRPGAGDEGLAMRNKDGTLEVINLTIGEAGERREDA